MSAEAKVAIDQLEHVRPYTLQLLDSVNEPEWFRMPPGGVTHIGWQAGHLAFAEYRLALERIRGARPEDSDVIPERFLQQFRAGSTPDPDPRKNPSPKEIKAVLERVHKRALDEARAFEGDWNATVQRPHPRFTTKVGSLLWCAQHEMIHAGQIGLLRRLLGSGPMW
jgi:DinB superfamily